MKSYTINGIPFEYDDTLTYMDFFVNENGPNLVEIHWDKLLSLFQKGELEPRNMKYELIMLDRWLRDVPRKRFYRKMVLDGMSVLSGEYWFDNMPDDEAEKIFTALLNSAVVARKLLQTHLPDIAKQCESENHPAMRYVIDP